MLVDIGLVPLEFYLYGSDDGDEVGEHQDGNATQYITEIIWPRTKTRKLKKIKTSWTMTTRSQQPAAVVFATAGNVIQPIVVTTGNETQSLAATTGN
jgi:hypothetical protein